MKVLAEGHPAVIEGLSVHYQKIVEKKLSGLDQLTVLILLHFRLNAEVVE
jgi:hypothetical protein